ncbi:DNA primase [Streptomyces antimycoticus]|uniref:DNA primase n=1 Tax=Streptomyces antimycoticus TaxID=68175 RepID=UPI0038695A49|nr:DNA primase [Streptomyces antimycoticus]
MTMKRCEHCRGAMPVLARAHAHYCSGRCRTAACRNRQKASDPVPTAMARRRQWVRHTDRKVPLSVNGRHTTPASSTDPSSWCTYKAACRSSAGAGLGFVLTSEDRVVCIDLDHAIVDGELRPWARAIVKKLPSTYVEVSPSGTGLHIWGYGSVGRGRKLRRGEAAIEVYDWGRYITVTRRPFEGAPSELADLSRVIADLL